MTRGEASATILIVEDDPDIRDAEEEVLQGSGYTTATAATGESALAYLRSCPPPAVILLDLMMPEVDGREFRRRQLADPALAGIPVVVVTAGSADQARDVGAAAIVKKPFPPETLLEAIARVTGKP